MRNISWNENDLQTIVLMSFFSFYDALSIKIDYAAKQQQDALFASIRWKPD
jgi:hypothetical protein